MEKKMMVFGLAKDKDTKKILTKYFKKWKKSIDMKTKKFSQYKI
jgi:hypothetical protein